METSSDNYSEILNHFRAVKPLTENVGIVTLGMLSITPKRKTKLLKGVYSGSMEPKDLHR